MPRAGAPANVQVAFGAACRRRRRRGCGTSSESGRLICREDVRSLERVERPPITEVARILVSPVPAPSPGGRTWTDPLLTVHRRGGRTARAERRGHIRTWRKGSASWAESPLRPVPQAALADPGLGAGGGVKPSTGSRTLAWMTSPSSWPTSCRTSIETAASDLGAGAATPMTRSKLGDSSLQATPLASCQSPSSTCRNWRPPLVSGAEGTSVSRSTAAPAPCAHSSRTRHRAKRHRRLTRHLHGCRPCQLICSGPSCTFPR